MRTSEYNGMKGDDEEWDGGEDVLTLRVMSHAEDICILKLIVRVSKRNENTRSAGTTSNRVVNVTRRE